ncbi:MAG: DUF6089 family protein [Bacteroidales bacterium]|nr:DUF6089 family protein [Bacteroidales bacterium]
MKNRKKFGIAVVIALFIGIFAVVNKANAQVVEVGLTGGLSSYYGDLNPIKPFNEAKLGFGAVVRYYQGSRWAFRFSYSNMNITASDEKVGICPERKLSFKTNINDFSLIAEFNFFDYWTGSRRNFVTPYIFAGIGVATFNPMTLDDKELCNVLTDVDGYADGDVNKIQDGTAKYNKCAVSVPFGLGVKYSVNKRIGLALEWRVHWAWTDWLDDCSGYYPLWNEGDSWAQYADPSGNLSVDGGNEIKYLKRGDSVKYDYYSFLNFTVAFKFNLPHSKRCDVGLNGRYTTF